MKTYQDWLACTTEDARQAFILSLIAAHTASTAYKTADKAEQYYRHLNPTIMHAQKITYDLMGRAHADVWAANNKIPCRYYFYLVTQAVQFLLGNGVSFQNEETKDKLGAKFDRNVQQAAVYALNGGQSFGFWNADHLDVFPLTQFAPLYDGETGALRAGVRFWRLASDTPLRCTLFEEDGLTQYIQRKGEPLTVLEDKRAYVLNVGKSEATGMEILDGENYPTLPIVPLWNTNRQSEIVGMQEVLDAYDLMASALVNNIDDANVIYWVIKNAGGMDDEDDERFIQRLRTMHVAHTEGEEQIDMHSVDVPFEASETALARLRTQIFDDFMGLDVKNIAGGAATATQIKAAYEPLNSRADLFEYEVTDFIEGILKLAGIEDEPTYTRSMIINQQELIQNLVSAGEYLSDDYITQKILEVLGDMDKVEDVLHEKAAADVSRFRDGDSESDNG